MKISDLLRWGPRKPTPAPKEPPHPPPTNERQSSDRRRVQGPAQLWWVNGSGEVVCGDGSFTEVGNEGIAAQLNKQAPLGKTAWFAFDNEQPWPSIIRHSEAVDDGFRVGATVELLATSSPSSGDGSGSVALEWFDSQGTLRSGAANVRSGSEGRLELNSDSAVPVREIVLLMGPEVCCLAVTNSCDKRGDRQFIEVEVLTEAAPKYSALAA